MCRAATSVTPVRIRLASPSLCAAAVADSASMGHTGSRLRGVMGGFIASLARQICGCSSAVERLVAIQKVGSSNLLTRSSFMPPGCALKQIAQSRCPEGGKPSPNFMRSWPRGEARGFHPRYAGSNPAGRSNFRNPNLEVKPNDGSSKDCRYVAGEGSAVPEVRGRFEVFSGRPERCTRKARAGQVIPVCASGIALPSEKPLTGSKQDPLDIE